MHIFKHISDLKKALLPFREKGAHIGFVPTMGALHKGHLSLIHECVSTDDVSVASIYVNPTQFNNREDLQRYPRDLGRDCEMLRNAHCDFVFVPSDAEMYPEPDTRVFDFGTMGMIMEGIYRPGHFNGVAQIVTRLFDIVEPGRAYFGQKDFQQLAIIRKLVSNLNYTIDIVACPIIREADGLAMSSRNMLLSEKERKSAPLIYQTLKQVRKQFMARSVTELEEFVIQNFNKSVDLKLEYFQIVDNETLQPVNTIRPDIPVTACIAVYAGKIRLIDNIELIS